MILQRACSTGIFAISFELQGFMIYNKIMIDIVKRSIFHQNKINNESFFKNDSRLSLFLTFRVN